MLGLIDNGFLYDMIKEINMARTHKPHRPYWEYPLRNCRTLHFCQICQGDIFCGEEYYDGGYSRRAHKDCAYELWLRSRPCMECGGKNGFHVEGCSGNYNQACSRETENE